MPPTAAKKPAQLSAWVQGLVRSDVTERTEPVRVYTRTLDDYASDITNAQKLIVARKQALLDAEAQLDQALGAFEDHCRSLGIPLDFERLKWPPVDYRMEE